MNAPSTPSPATSLTMRAQAAAAVRRADTDEPAAWRKPHWAARAEASATALAQVLGVSRERITVDPDRMRAYGDWPWPRMSVTEPDGTRHEFTAGFNDPNQLLALAPCPVCGGQVPLVSLRHLADLGDLLAGDLPAEPALVFREDPGHRPDCQHAAH